MAKKEKKIIEKETSRDNGRNGEVKMEKYILNTRSRFCASSSIIFWANASKTLSLSSTTTTVGAAATTTTTTSATM